MKRSFLCFSVMILGSAAIARAADSVPLRMNLQPGQKWTFDETQDSDSKNTATLNGQSQPFGTKSHQRIVGTCEVGNVSNGVPTSLKVTFDKACEISNEFNGQQNKVPFPYGTDPITLTRNADGSVTDDFNGQAAPSAVSELHSMMDRDDVLMPPHPVAVGDQWSGDPATVGRFLQLAGKDTGGMTLKLLSVKTVDDRQVAEVKVSMAAINAQGTMTVKAVAQGTTLVDLATGHVLKTDFAGTVDVNGTQPGPGQGGQQVNYDITGSGKLTVTAESPFSGNVPAALPLANNTTPDNAGSGGVNPLGLKPENPFAGTFSDEKLKVDLKPKGDAYEGTFTLGNQTFPATATGKDTSLTGSFTAGGNPFQFNATLDGDTLNLTTGGATYHLKKAVANPLDTGPANPLAPRTDAGPAAAPPVTTTALGEFRPAAAPTDYNPLTTVAHGQAWLSFEGGVNSATAAIKKCVKDISPSFADSIKVSHAAVDDKDREGFAPFTAVVDGQPVNGKVVCTPLSTGTFVSVLIARTDAAADEWTALTAAVPTVPVMHPIMLPGNNGTVCVPDGWNITGGDATMGAVTLEGTNGEKVVRSTFINFDTARRWQRLGIRPVQGANVSEFMAPDKAMPMLAERINQSGGSQHFAIQHMDVTPMPIEGNPDSAAVAQLIRSSILITENGKDTLTDSCDWDISSHMSNGDSWNLMVNGISAPHVIFAHVLPTLVEIYNSYTVDNEAVKENTERAINHIVATAQQIHDQQDRLFQAGQRVNADREAARHKSAMDTVEMLRGTRTVEDSQTGRRYDADYYNVNGTVDALNHDAGYDRFKQIPLSSEQ